MNKYIIKNCPCYSWEEGCKNGKVEEWHCQYCTDCLLKKIVEKCREEIRTNDRWSDSRTFAEEILELLEIEECEE